GYVGKGSANNDNLIFINNIGGGNYIQLYDNGDVAINAAGTGVLRSNVLAGTGTRMVVANPTGALSTQAIPAAQTLSLGASAGSITISGGNSVNISSLYQTEYPDANSSLGTGVHTRIYTTGSENYPTSTGGG